MELDNLPVLNLPQFNFKIKQEENTLFILDEIRNKFITLTPEEWVRQNFIKFITESLKYPKSMIKIEGRLTKGSSSKRTDIIVYQKSLSPFMLIECKSSNIEINQETLNQIAKYNLKVKAPFIVITNGLNHYIFNIDFENNKINQIKEFPEYK